MARPTSRAGAVDGMAITLSGLCLIHCLMLPILSATLPVAGAIGEAEWLHQAFVAAALPFAIIGLRSKQITPLAGTLIVSGLGLLFAGAFVEAWHDFETTLTVLGAVLLASGHVLRWSNSDGHA